jgi:hypothetical protein
MSYQRERRWLILDEALPSHPILKAPEPHVANAFLLDDLPDNVASTFDAVPLVMLRCSPRIVRCRSRVRHMGADNEIEAIYRGADYRGTQGS